MQRRLTDSEYHDVAQSEAAIRRLTVGGLISPLALVEALTSMRINGTTDGMPYVEPELTELDAIKRVWVRAKNCSTLYMNRPLILVDKLPNGKYVTRNEDGSGVSIWDHVRRATPEEIAAAGLKVAG
jgi:hypothetical protein